MLTPHNFLNRTVTVGATKTAAGTGRVIPLNKRALMTLQAWAMHFADRQPEHCVFPWEHYGFAGTKAHAKTMDPTVPVGDITTGWEAAKARAKVVSRFHDLRHTCCTRLLERGGSLSVVASIMGWSASTTAKMAQRYGHIGATPNAPRSTPSRRCRTDPIPTRLKNLRAPMRPAIHSGWAQIRAQSQTGRRTAVVGKNGAPCTTRTCDLLVRSHTTQVRTGPTLLAISHSATRRCHAFQKPKKANR